MDVNANDSEVLEFEQELSFSTNASVMLSSSGEAFLLHTASKRKFAIKRFIDSPLRVYALTPCCEGLSSMRRVENEWNHFCEECNKSVNYVMAAQESPDLASGFEEWLASELNPLELTVVAHEMAQLAEDYSATLDLLMGLATDGCGIQIVRLETSEDGVLTETVVPRIPAEAPVNLDDITTAPPVKYVLRTDSPHA